MFRGNSAVVVCFNHGLVHVLIVLASLNDRRLVRALSCREANLGNIKVCRASGVLGVIELGN